MSSTVPTGAELSTRVQTRSLYVPWVANAYVLIMRATPTAKQLSKFVRMVFPSLLHCRKNSHVLVAQSAEFLIRTTGAHALSSCHQRAV